MVSCGSPPPISARDCDIRVVAVFSIIKTLTSQAMPEILRQEMYLYRDVVDLGADSPPLDGSVTNYRL